VRLSEVCGLHRDRRVVPLASDAPALIGIAGLRARVLPVFSLARLLGYAEADPPRWLIVCGEDEGAIALAFAGFEGHRELAASALHAAGVAEGRAHVREVARGADGVLPVVSATSIRAAITAAGRPVAA
jgi:chemotaxis signal transduction protein